MALAEVTVAWLGNFGTLEFWGPGSSDYPPWGPLPRPQDVPRLPHFSHLNQPPVSTQKLRFYWGNEDESGFITYSLVEFDFPGPPPGFTQEYRNTNPPGAGKVELQIGVNVGLVVGGEDQQYFQLLSTAGGFLGYWQADTGEWVAWPDPDGRSWTYTMRRTPASWWAVTAVYELGTEAECPPVPRPPWPYSDSSIRLATLSSAVRLLKRRVSGGAVGSAEYMGSLAALNEAKARYEFEKAQQQQSN
jgi:hypothetical protein